MKEVRLGPGWSPGLCGKLEQCKRGGWVGASAGLREQCGSGVVDTGGGDGSAPRRDCGQWEQCGSAERTQAGGAGSGLWSCGGWSNSGCPLTGHTWNGAAGETKAGQRGSEGCEAEQEEGLGSKLATSHKQEEGASEPRERSEQEEGKPQASDGREAGGGRGRLNGKNRPTCTLSD